MDIVTAILLAMSIPSAFTGLCFWMVERKIDKREKLREKKETAREENQCLMIQGIRASIALGEATAHAIRDGKCNGEMSSALEYAQKIKHEQTDFLTRQGTSNLF